MTNELLWMIFLIFDFGMALLAIRFFGKKALFAIIVIDIIICNIQVLKTISLFGIITTTGNILYGSIFLATDLLSEVYGKKEARQGVLLGFFALLFMTISFQLTIAFHPHASDFAHSHFKILFGILPRIALASLAAYLVSQLHDIWAFHFWKSKTKGKYLWLRNNLSTLVSQMIDSLVFVSIAFLGIYPLGVVVQIFISTYLFKLMVAVLDTPVIYLGKHILLTYHGKEAKDDEQ
ncbi:MAG: queuosine precursor transporter [Calditrichia bacterium]